MRRKIYRFLENRNILAYENYTSIRKKKTKDHKMISIFTRMIFNKIIRARPRQDGTVLFTNVTLDSKTVFLHFRH